MDICGQMIFGTFCGVVHCITFEADPFSFVKIVVLFSHDRNLGFGCIMCIAETTLKILLTWCNIVDVGTNSYIPPQITSHIIKSTQHFTSNLFSFVLSL